MKQAMCKIPLGVKSCSWRRQEYSRPRTKGCSGRANPRGKKAWKHTRSSGAGAGIESLAGRRASPCITTPSATNATRSVASIVDCSQPPDILDDSAAERVRLVIDFGGGSKRRKKKVSRTRSEQRKRRWQWLGKNLIL